MRGPRSPMRIQHPEVLVLAFGAIGLAMLPAGALGEPRTIDLVVLAACFATPLVAGFVGVLRPPLGPWRAAASLLGFAIAAGKLEVWNLATRVMDLDARARLLVIAAAAGTLVAGLAVYAARSPRPDVGARDA